MRIFDIQENIIARGARVWQVHPASILQAGAQGWCGTTSIKSSAFGDRGAARSSMRCEGPRPASGQVAAGVAPEMDESIMQKLHNGRRNQPWHRNA